MKLKRRMSVIKFFSLRYTSYKTVYFKRTCIHTEEGRNKLNLITDKPKLEMKSVIYFLKSKITFAIISNFGQKTQQVLVDFAFCTKKETDCLELTK